MATSDRAKALAALLGGDLRDDENRSFGGSLETEARVLRDVFDEYTAERSFQPGDIVRLRAEWRGNSKLADHPAVIVEMFDKPVEPWRAPISEPSNFHSNSVAERLDMRIASRSTGVLLMWLADSRLYELAR